MARLVSVFSRVTAAPGTKAPCGSVMTPRMDPRYCACAMAAKRTMQATIETVRSAEEVEEVERLMTPPVLLEVQFFRVQRLLKLYKSVLVTLEPLIAQAIFHSQAHCFQLVL